MPLEIHMHEQLWCIKIFPEDPKFAKNEDRDENLPYSW